jgi:hypothetical protein
LIGISAAIVLLIVVSIVVTVAAGDEPEELPEGSPERAVQDYLLALERRDYGAAYALLSPEIQSRCSLQDFERSSGTIEPFDVTVRLDEVRMTSTGAEVYVRITQTFANPPILVPNQSSFTQRYFLIRVDSAWRLADPVWPYACYDRPIVITPTPTPTPTPSPTVTV